jgi:hypothetical protein
LGGDLGGDLGGGGGIFGVSYSVDIVFDMLLVYRWRSSMLLYAPYFKTRRRSQLPFINLGAKLCCAPPSGQDMN